MSRRIIGMCGVKGEYENIVFQAEERRYEKT